MRSISNTFILTAPDCPVEYGVVPAVKAGAKPSVHALQYELLSRHPYRYTLDDLIYEVHIRHKEIPQERLDREGESIRQELLSKSHPCMRASMLPKRYGWGAHYDAEGRIALYGRETEEYQRFADGGVPGHKLEYAIRSKRG